MRDRRRTIATLGLLLACAGGSLRAESERADYLMERVRADFQGARSVYRAGAGQGQAVLAQLADTRPSQMLSCLLELVAGVEQNDKAGGASGVDPGNDPLLRERFARAAAGALAESSGSPALSSAMERLLLSSEREDGPLRRSRDLSDEAGQMIGDGRSGEAIGLFREASAAASEAGDEWFEMRSLVRVGQAELSAGLEGAAVVTLADAATKALDAGDPLWAAEALIHEGRALILLGSPERALDRFTDAVELLEGEGQAEWSRETLGEAADACLRSASAALVAGDVRGAEAMVTSGTRFARLSGDGRLPPRLKLTQAEILGATGQGRRAAPLLREALEGFRALADDAGMSAAAVRLAALVEPEDRVEAGRLLREASEAEAALGDDRTAGELVARAVELLRKGGRGREAMEAVDDALSEQFLRPELDAGDRLHLTRGDLLLEQAEFGEAAAAYHQVRGGGDIARRARWGEGIAWLEIGRPSLAADHLLSALPPVGPPSRALLSAAAIALERSGRLAERSALIEEIAASIELREEAEKDSPLLLATVAQLAILTGSREEALPIASRLAGMEDPLALFDAAALQSGLGNRAVARRLLGRARGLGLDPVLAHLDPALAHLDPALEP